MPCLRPQATRSLKASRDHYNVASPLTLFHGFKLGGQEDGKAQREEGTGGWSSSMRTIGIYLRRGAVPLKTRNTCWGSRLKIIETHTLRHRRARTAVSVLAPTDLVLWTISSPGGTVVPNMLPGRCTFALPSTPAWLSRLKPVPEPFKRGARRQLSLETYYDSESQANGELPTLLATPCSPNCQSFFHGGILPWRSL